MLLLALCVLMCVLVNVCVWMKEADKSINLLSVFHNQVSYVKKTKQGAVHVKYVNICKCSFTLSSAGVL